MNLPADFIAQARTQLGQPLADELVAALQTTEPPVSVRLNPRKWSEKAAETRPNIFSATVPWASSAHYLNTRPPFTFDPLLHAGCYYVQEAASMFVEQAIRTYSERPSVVLDLCAAPGGKSTLLRSLLPDECLLVANEPVRARAQVLAENLTKWGHPSTVITNNYPADFAPLAHVFDMLLVDAPCSGEGMFRKDEQAVAEWSPDAVLRCQARQRQILQDVWPALKPGGLLIYSTCTFNILENEENVAWAASKLGAEILPLPVADEWHVTGNLLDGDFPVFRFLPSRTKGEGFFLAVLRKKAADDEIVCSSPSRKKEKKAQKTKTAQPVPELCREWLLPSDDFLVSWTDENKLTAIPRTHADTLAALRTHLNVMQVGITLGEQKGKALAPAHALAMSTALNAAAFPRAELTYSEAIAYLRSEAVGLPADTPHGFILLTYKGVPLGFAKNVGNRANNLYPQMWRIRSGHVPDEAERLF